MSGDPSTTEVPEALESAYSRLLFPPSYVVVGAYRLLVDPSIRKPAWDKCKHGTVRGAVVGFIWVCLTFRIQRKIIEMFYMNSPRITGLSQAGFFGYQLPISVPTYAALFWLSEQVTGILKFFISRNIRIARERAYAQTVVSRGKSESWWGPYVEERANPPRVGAKDNKGWSIDKMLGTFVGRLILRNVILAPFSFTPMVGIVISAWIKALGTARYLHRPYFEVKKMSANQVAVFVEERKWEYRAFGFTSALLEGLPIIGLVFSISNRVGAAMWAHDLEKNQHFVHSQLRSGKPLPNPFASGAPPSIPHPPEGASALKDVPGGL